MRNFYYYVYTKHLPTNPNFDSLTSIHTLLLDLLISDCSGFQKEGGLS